MQAWENIYDEPCIYAVVRVGAHPAFGTECPDGRT